MTPYFHLIPPRGRSRHSPPTNHDYTFPLFPSNCPLSTRSHSKICTAQQRSGPGTNDIQAGQGRSAARADGGHFTPGLARAGFAGHRRRFLGGAPGYGRPHAAQAGTLTQWRLLDRVKINPGETPQKYSGPAFSFLGPSLYSLGPVGVEIATQRHGVLPPTGYQLYLPTRVIHDLIVNEIVLRLAQAIGERGWEVEWLGKYEGTLRETGQERTLVEPDALIRFRRDGQERAFLLEYHNEDKSSRAEDKVKRYEAAYADGDWRKAWEVDTFPPVLAVCLHPIVSTGYINTLQGRRTRCVYYGKMLKPILDGNVSDWVNISTNEREDILPVLKDENSL